MRHLLQSPFAERELDIVRLTVRDVCTATGGSLVRGRQDTVFTAVTIDSRLVQPGALFVPLPGSNVDGHAYIAEAVQRGAAGFFCTKAADPTTKDDAAAISVRDSLTALQQLSAWYRDRLTARVVGIAGSNGKTTTKELLAQVCAGQKRTLATQGNFNNHIGVPLTLLRAEQDVEIMVLELGTSGAGELTTLCRFARPHIGVITSIAEEHTETLTDLAGVLAAETELISDLPPEGVAIVNGDDPMLVEAVTRLAACRVVTFGEKTGNQWRAAEVQVSRHGTSFMLQAPTMRRQVQLPLLGSHFALAAVASLTVAAECGLDTDRACTILSTATGAPRRLTVINVPERHLTILDDCYNANPASMRQAILTATQVRAANERLILVLGDMLELGALSQQRHEEMGEFVTSLTPPPDLLVTVGVDANLIASAARGQGLTARAFPLVAEAAAFVQETARDFTGSQLVLVKGSRGVHLEEVTRYLEK
jgi:UDP-N-acetylmuramoyl-tripeptide--D-alanyl-D-alanine ligase